MALAQTPASESKAAAKKDTEEEMLEREEAIDAALEYEICATITQLCKAASERDELVRKLACAEAQLIRQTGCTAENVVGIYNLPTPKPVVNVRMGESHRLRFQAEDENARLRAQVAALVSAGAKTLDELNARIEAAPITAKPVFQGIAELHAAIAAAEREGKNND